MDHHLLGSVVQYQTCSVVEVRKAMTPLLPFFLSLVLILAPIFSTVVCIHEHPIVNTQQSQENHVT